MLKEFKEFAIKGNVIDLAVGVVIGTAFGKIVSSFVADILMPPLSILLGNIDLREKSFILKPATDSAGAISMNYGLFLNNCLDFFIVAFTIFIVIKQINRFKRDKVTEDNSKVCPFCISHVPLKATKCHSCGSAI